LPGYCGTFDAVSGGVGTPVPFEMTDGSRRAAAFERIERPVFALDGDWRFSYVNDGARRLLTDGRELEGRIVWDALPGVMDTGIPETFHEASTTGENRSTTVPFGGNRHVELQVFPGEEGMTVLLEDVTERHRQRQHRRRYETAFNAADDPIYVLDANGRFREVNDAMVALTGYEEDELLGESMALLLDAAELERAEERIQTTMAEDEASVGTIETTIRTAGGERRTCAVNVALLPDDEGMRGTVGVMRDVTDRAQREQRLAVLDRVLRHNIRNEMNVVMGRARIAQRQADEEMADHLGKILEKAEDLVAVSRAVRRFADALDPGLGTAQPRDAVDSVRLIVDDLREEFPDAELRLVVRDTGWMRAHESVFAAVEEVIRNGIEHTGVDVPRVVVTLDTTGPPGEGEVTVEVADNGPGMPEDERSVLTEGGETQLTHASGIGLWLVNWAVTKSGGDLGFEENEPTGSVVTMRLPRVPRPPEDGESPEGSPGAGARTDGGS
jgi:PAS domain S-box-containing protein